MKKSAIRWAFTRQKLCDLRQALHAEPRPWKGSRENRRGGLVSRILCEKAPQRAFRQAQVSRERRDDAPERFVRPAVTKPHFQGSAPRRRQRQGRSPPRCVPRAHGCANVELLDAKPLHEQTQRNRKGAEAVALRVPKALRQRLCGVEARDAQPIRRPAAPNALRILIGHLCEREASDAN
eukprot:scaffold73_cov252-Pinguiococcus_pyrenoidosus.AAC.15